MCSTVNNGRFAWNNGHFWQRYTHTHSQFIFPRPQTPFLRPRLHQNPTMMTDMNDQVNTNNTNKTTESLESRGVNVVETTTPKIGTETHDTETETHDTDIEEPLTPPRTVDFESGGKYDHLLFGSSSSSSSSSSDDDWTWTPTPTSSESTPLCHPYGDQFGTYSMSMCDRYYDCQQTPFHTPTYIPFNSISVVTDSPPRKRVRRRLFPHDNTTPPTPKYFRNIKYID